MAKSKGNQGVCLSVNSHRKTVLLTVDHVEPIDWVFIFNFAGRFWGVLAIIVRITRNVRFL